ncbi:hypothetical protein B484DRAFT_443345 [Ochromonadaceae sp. CCMP2298]|nr:hypothetical protein B484DRAFT_443345 [Ochromonadaceae sp. CCMP2298]|mmetsp:Transcript_33955/g.73344  ORF Transcript_33955/g.73344 Transcript_33955/m.73344 type:complete len:459 (+) Transcript_33955:111-1487(+)
MWKLLLLFLAAIACFGAADNSGEQSLEDAIKGSLSLDFSVYNKDDELYVNIINEDGYRICDGKISRRNLEQIRCTYDKDLLRYGDNTFFITVYSTKTNNIILQTTSHFFYDHSPTLVARGVGFVKRRKGISLALLLAPLSAKYIYDHPPAMPHILASGILPKAWSAKNAAAPKRIVRPATKPSLASKPQLKPQPKTKPVVTKAPTPALKPKPAPKPKDVKPMSKPSTHKKAPPKPKPQHKPTPPTHKPKPSGGGFWGSAASRPVSRFSFFGGKSTDKKKNPRFSRTASLPTPTMAKSPMSGSKDGVFTPRATRIAGFMLGVLLLTKGEQMLSPRVGSSPSRWGIGRNRGTTRRPPAPASAPVEHTNKHGRGNIRPQVRVESSSFLGALQSKLKKRLSSLTESMETPERRQLFSRVYTSCLFLATQAAFVILKKVGLNKLPAGNIFGPDSFEYYVPFKH